MKKSKSSGEHIHELRESRHETQEQFAKHLGVKRAAVSAWEKDDKLRRPSAVIYLRLAALAPSPEEAAWFLKLAAVDERVIFSLAESLSAGKAARASDIEMVPISPLSGSKDIGEIVLQKSRVPNPGFTYYAAGIWDAIWLSLLPGVIVVDTRHRGTLVYPFWEKVALVRMAADDPETYKYVIGLVHQTAPEQAVPFETTEGFATLAGAYGPRPFEGVRIGRWAHPEHGNEEFHRALREDRAGHLAVGINGEVQAGIKHRMRVDPGIEIVGEVIAWFPEYEPRYRAHNPAEFDGTLDRL